MPPCTVGCSVLTRPSIISGKPVTSETLTTGSPASARALAVPPVETSFEAAGVQGLGEGHQAGLVGDTQQRSADGDGPWEAAPGEWLTFP